MVKVRNTMLLAALAATAVTSVGGYALLGGPATRILLDAGLAAALAVIISASLSPTQQRLSGIVELLRALARGERQQRVDPDDFAELAELARAANEVAASMSESDDPNLGPVRSVPRPPTPGLRRTEEQNLSEHPELGPVRAHKRLPEGQGSGAAHGLAAARQGGQYATRAGTTPERMPAVSEPRRSHSASRHAARLTAALDDDVSEPRRLIRSPVNDGVHAGRNDALSPSEPPPSGPPPPEQLPSGQSDVEVAHETAVHDGRAGNAPGSELPRDAVTAGLAAGALASDDGPFREARDASVRDAVATRGNDTAVDGPEESTPPAQEVASGPSRAEIEALFHDFVSRKRSKDQSVMDLDLEAFIETIQSECERLLVAHQCKGVRFEVAEVEDEVSLRPRLLR